MSDIARLIRHQVARGKKKRRRGYADGGDVDADEMIQRARLRLASLPQREVTGLPDVGSPLVGDGGQFSSGTDWGNKAADIGNKLGYGAMTGLATLPRRAIENSQQSLDSGNYDPSSSIEAALLSMGTGAVAGVPVKGAETVLGAGPIRAYHGSPYDFDKFDISKIGAGEGHQAYGHGLYFAENPAVAKEYRDKLSYKGDRPAMYSPDDLVRDISAKLGSREPNVIYQKLREDIKNGLGTSYGQMYKEATEKLINPLEVSRALPGRGYEVNIRADPAQMLNWDKPLEKQNIWGKLPENVRGSIDDAMDARGLNPMGDVLEDYTGKDLFRALQHEDVHETLPAVIGKSDWYKGDTTEKKHVSAFLESLDVPGIKYLDQGSRHASTFGLGNLESQLKSAVARNDTEAIKILQDEIASIPKPSSNYVMFDDKLIDILKKYGIAGAAAPAVAQEIMQQGEQHFASGGRVEGMLEPGNIDLDNRPIVHNDDGSISTVRSIGANVGDKEMLLPTVYGGSILSNDDAIRLYRMSGKHLGQFDTPENSDAYAKSLHEDQDMMYRGRVGYAEGGAPADLPDAPWATPAPKSDALPDAPWATGAAAPAAPPVEAKIPLNQAIPGDVNAAMPEAYGDPNRGIGASIARAVPNIPHSAYEFAKNTVQPILHPIDTATSLKNLGLGILEKTGIVSGKDHEKYADAVGKFFSDRYGGIDNARRTFEQDPVGMAGDLSMLLTAGGSGAARLPGVAGKVGEVVNAAGRVVDPMTPALSAANTVAKGVGRVGTEVAGVTTGVGGQSLKVAGEAGYEGGHAGRTFRENMRGEVPLESAVNDARGAVAQLRHERGDAYRQSMSKTGAVGSDTAILDFNKIDNAVMHASGVQSYSGRYGTGPAQSLSPKTQGIRTEMTDAIEHWKGLDPVEFHSAEGIDALKKQLGDIRDATQPHTPDRVVADRIYNAVRQTIVDQVPEYAKVMKGYETASKQIKEIETTLSLNPKASVDTALRKLQSSLRDNVNTSFGRRTELVDFLTRAGAPHLMEKLAGQTLHSWTPRGLGRFVAGADLPAMGAAIVAGHPLAAAGIAATLPTMSPRLMGEAVHLAGRAARRVKPLGKALRPSRQIGQVTGAMTPYGEEPGTPYQ